jgi:SAM-dependent methyltransferase
MLKLNYLLRAVFNPASVQTNATLFRQLLLKPRVFDFVSCLLQLRDHRRLSKIQKDRPQDEFYATVKDYNAGVTQKKLVTTTRRAEMLYQVLSLPPRDLSNEKLLIVGPRNVQELFIAWLYGYNWKNIQAIDLYSTNRKILVMNMEDLAFPNDSFDAIVMAFTLAYAKDTFKCLSEMSRVLKPSGRFVFGASYTPQGSQWPGSLISGQEIHQMLKSLGCGLTYHHAFDKINSLGGETTLHVFSVQKRDAVNPGLGGVGW